LHVNIMQDISMLIDTIRILGVSWVPLADLNANVPKTTY
jgi:hypothetical protein